jgi:endonuclease I
VRHLHSSRYSPCNHTAGLWQHHTRPLTFFLVVDDFAVKYVDEADANHLLQALESRYTVTTDWDAKMYCALSLTWDYVKRIVDISMPGYVEKALQRFCHIPAT